MTSPAKFVREVRQETSKVIWPTRREALISTAMILVLVTITAIFFLIVDNLAGRIIELILGLGA